MSDKLEGWPHPSKASNIIGHDDAWKEVVTTWKTGRMPHCWLLTGPKGVGKATFAYKMAAFVNPDKNTVRVLKKEPDDKGAKLKTIISVDEVRALKSSFIMRATEQQWRICLIDTIDDMNLNAANALLKLIEEPPPRTIFILLSHEPNKLLPTIRSRCRVLGLQPLTPYHVVSFLMQHDIDPALAQVASILAEGSIGKAAIYAQAVYQDITQQVQYILEHLPALDTARVLQLVDNAQTNNKDKGTINLVNILTILLARMTRCIALQQPCNLLLPQEPVWHKLWPQQTASVWAESVFDIKKSFEEAHTLHLDPHRTILDMFFNLKSTAEQLNRLSSHRT